MITMQSAESALKNIYLDSVINDINTKTNPFLTMVQKNAKTVNSKEARAAIRYGNEASVQPGIEGGDLPVSNGGMCVEIVSPLKNLYGTFQISDKAIRAAQNDAKAFTSLISSEMQNLIGTAQSNLNGMLYGNGLAFKGHGIIDTSVNVRTITVSSRSIRNFKENEAIVVLGPNNEKLHSSASVQIESIDNAQNKIKYTGTCNATKFDRVYVYSASGDGLALNGIDSIFMPDKIYNVNISEHEDIAPCIITDTDTDLNILCEDEIMRFVDAYEEHCQGMPADIMLTHPTVRKAVFENLRNTRLNFDTAELAGGFKGFSFNGVPVYSDVKCKGGTLYALNSDSWNMHQLCDWTWLSGDDGSVLKQIDGKAGYSATLVKYADLICNKPFIQGKVTGYSALRSM